MCTLSVLLYNGTLLLKIYWYKYCLEPLARRRIPSQTMREVRSRLDDGQLGAPESFIQSSYVKEAKYRLANIEGI